MSFIDHIKSEAIRKASQIPFGNSQFQNENFVEYANITPARAYRSLLLKVISRLNDIKEFEFNLEESVVNIEEWEYQKSDDSISIFDQKRADIKIRREKESIGYNQKLLSDALIEVNQLWEAISKYPEYTREQFEAQELQHFEDKLNRQFQLPQGKEGVVESIINMRTDKTALLGILESSVKELNHA